MHSHEFYKVCKKIVADDNYRPDCTPAQLLDLVMKDGIPRYVPTRSAMGIKPSMDACDLGRLFDFLITDYGVPSGSNDSCSKTWYVGNIKLLVRYNGSASFHDLNDLTFARPFTRLSLDDALGINCLFTEEGRAWLTPNPALSR